MRGRLKTSMCFLLQFSECGYATLLCKFLAKETNELSTLK